MYEKYSKQALPSKKYRELLGSALCVFNSNSAFVIENILHINSKDFKWYDLIDLESGKLKSYVKKTISKNSSNTVYELFDELITMRNRIVHSFQVTYNGNQVLFTKDKLNKQFCIDEEYLMNFIKLNENLADELYNVRDEVLI